MSQKHDTQSNAYEFKQKDMNEKEHEFAEDELYPSSTDDMTCWEKFKNAWNNFINRSIDYFEFDRLFNSEGEQKIEINKCYKRFLENYDETYSERQIRFAFTFEYVLEEKIRQQSRKQKNLIKELYRFICCEGGNQMVEIDQAYKSDREYQKIVRKKLIQKKQIFQEMLKKQVEEQKEKEIEQKKKGQQKIVKEKFSQRKKNEYNQPSRQKPEEFISYEDFCFEEEDIKNNKAEKATANQVKQVTKLKTNIVKINQSEHHIFQNQSQLNISQKTQKIKSNPSTALKSTKPTEKDQQFIDYNDEIEDFTHKDKKQNRISRGNRENTNYSTKNQILTKNTITTTTHQNIFRQNHVHDEVQEVDIKKQKKRKLIKAIQNDEFKESPTQNSTNQKIKNSSTLNQLNQKKYDQPTRILQSNDPQYSNFQARQKEQSTGFQQSTVKRKRNEPSRNPQYEQNERSYRANDPSSFPEEITNSYSSSNKNDSPRKNQKNHLQSYNPAAENEYQDAQYSHQKTINNKTTQGKKKLSQQTVILKNQKISPMIYNEISQNNQVYETQILSPGKPRQKQQLQSSPKINNDQTNMVFNQFQEEPKENLNTSQKKRKSKKQQAKIDEPQVQRQLDGIYNINQRNNQDKRQKQENHENHEKYDVASKAKKIKKTNTKEQQGDKMEIRFDDFPQPQQSQHIDSITAKKMKKTAKNMNKLNEEEFDNQIDIADDFSIQKSGDNIQGNDLNQVQMAIKKRKTKKSMVRNDVSNEQQIEIQNDLTENQQMKPKWNTIDVSNLSQSENFVQASKKRRNKKQLRTNEDDLKIDEVVIEENNEFASASNIQGQELGGSSFVKAQKKRKKGRQMKERQDQDEQIIQIDF